MNATTATSAVAADFTGFQLEAKTETTVKDNYFVQGKKVGYYSFELVPRVREVWIKILKTKDFAQRELLFAEIQRHHDGLIAVTTQLAIATGIGSFLKQYVQEKTKT
jgi:hypothetical protein